MSRLQTSFSAVLSVLLLGCFSSVTPAASVTFNYDHAGRLRRATYSATNRIDFSYDNNGNLLQRLTILNSTLVDTDLDGMDDNWEETYFGGLDQPADGDFDADGLYNSTEESINSDPTGRPPPDWWTTYNVLSPGSTNDFAAVNQGQLFSLATNAYRAMSVRLDGGAGTEVQNKVAAFTHNHHFSAVNIGQVKELSSCFYDRLIEKGLADTYPWTGCSHTNDYATINAGQVKHIFSFELPQ